MHITENVKQVITKFTCAFCNANIGFDVLFADFSELVSEYGDPLTGIAFAIVRCNQCLMLHNFTFDVIQDEFGFSCKEEWEVDHFRHNNPAVLRAIWVPDEPFAEVTWLKLLGQYPYNQYFSKHIPQHIQKELREAGNCLAFGAYNAAAVMCGRVLEHIVNEYVPDAKGPLGRRMKKLTPVNGSQERQAGKTMIQRPIYDALGEAIEWRNEGAHILEKFLKTPADICELHELTIRIAEYVFAEREIDSLTQKLRSTRIEKNTE